MSSLVARCWLRRIRVLGEGPGGRGPQRAKAQQLGFTLNLVPVNSESMRA